MRIQCRITQVLGLTFILTALATAQQPSASSTYSPSDVVPAIANTSAASFREEALARGSIASVFGTGVATQTVIASTVPLPKTLGGVTVKINGVVASLFFVSPNQINYLVPDNLPDGEAEMTISNTAIGQTHKGMLSVAGVSPGIFTANADGRGVPAGAVLRVKVNGSQAYEPVSEINPASGRFVPVEIDLGSAKEVVVLVLFGTGWRNLSSQENVTVYIGGVKARVHYAGEISVFEGLDQMNVFIPREVAGKGIVPVLVIVDGKTANPVDIWVK